MNFDGSILFQPSGEGRTLCITLHGLLSHDMVLLSTAVHNLYWAGYIFIGKTDHYGEQIQPMWSNLKYPLPNGHGG